MKKLCLLIACLFLISTANSADAKKGSDKEGKRKGGKHGLKLTEEQQKEFKEIHAAKKKARKDMKEATKEVYKELRKLVKADEPDEAAINDALAKIDSAQEAFDAENKRIKDQLKSILSPVQQAKMALKHGKKRGGDWKHGKEGKRGRDGDWKERKKKHGKKGKKHRRGKKLKKYHDDDDDDDEDEDEEDVEDDDEDEDEDDND